MITETSYQINLPSQIMKFLVIGSLTFAVDYLSMLMFIEILGINYLFATALGFLLGSLLNYWLSIKYVFIRGKFNKTQTELIVFMIFTVLGLLLNHLIMYLGCEWGGISYKIVKFLSLFTVTIFNFIAKKYFVFLK